MNISWVGLREYLNRSARLKLSLCALVVFSAASLSHISALRHSFVGDDFNLIVNNNLMADRQTVALLIDPRDWSSPAAFKSGARPLTVLSLMADYRLWQLKPVGYHLTNLLLHGLNSCLVFFLAAMLLVEPDNCPWALFAGLVFALHPVQAEAVNIAAYRADLLATLFYLAALIFFARATINEKNKIVFYALAAIAFIPALFAKESAVTLPAAALLCQWIFSKPMTSSSQRWRLVFFCMLSAAALLLFLGFWRPRADYWPNGLIFTSLIGGASPLQSPTAYIGTLLLSLLHHLKTLALPLRLSIEYQLPLAGPGFYLRTGAALLSLGALAASWFLLPAPLFRFGLGFGLIAYLPISNLMPLSSTIADRYMYLPMAGFCLALTAAGIKWRGLMLRPILGHRLSMTGTSACALLCFYSAATAQANGRFQDMFTLYSTAAEIAPDNARVRYHLALANMMRHDYRSALAEFEKSMTANPLFMRLEIWDFLGTCYAELGDLNKAKKFYRKAVLIDARRETLNKLTEVLWRMDDRSGAILLLKKSLAIFPDAISYNNLGYLYAQNKEPVQAAKCFKQAIALQPSYADAWINLLQAYEQMGDKKSVQRETDRMARLFAANHWGLAIDGRTTYAP